VIEEIMKMILRSTQEEVNKDKPSRGYPSIIAGKKKKNMQQQQRHRWRGARGKLHKIFWDLGGFQHWRRGAHE
jgi:hypothetical protein